MGFTTPILFSVFFCVSFGSAIPAANEYTHYIDPGCPGVGASNCDDTYWCKYHRDKGDLFRGGFLRGRDVPEPEDLDLDLKNATRELDVNWKRTNSGIHLVPQSVQCGTLSCPDGLDISDRFGSLSPGVFYDLIVDYPYEGATGGIIGIFANVLWAANGVYRTRLAGGGRTNGGGICFTFQAIDRALWHQVVFVGDIAATAAVNFLIIKHQDV